MTIKEFADLCKCTTQTLRYYDKIDLLKPVKVDQWSGYRYYAESQAIDFVKIRNLQAADFTIDKIKKLLSVSDTEVYEAFNLKIAEQAQKLERIKQIQRSYLAEKNNMEKLINGISDFITSQFTDFEILREFGLSPNDGTAVLAQVKSYFEQQVLRNCTSEDDVTLIVDKEAFRGADNVANAINTLKGSDLNDTILLGGETVTEEEWFVSDQWDTLWECGGWKHVYEFMDKIPHMDEGREYCLFLRLNEEKYDEYALQKENEATHGDDSYRISVVFSMFMIGAMLLREKSEKISMFSNVEKSTDGLNRFALMIKR